MSEEQKKQDKGLETITVEQEVLQDQPEEVVKEEQYLLGWKRALADYDNLKKEMETKSKEWMDVGMMQLLSRITPVYSNFKQAVQYIPQDQQQLPWVTGIMYILTNMTDALSEVGITAIPTVGHKADDKLHEILSVEPGDGESGVIVKELAPGFTKDGKTLVHAKVVVRS